MDQKPSILIRYLERITYNFEDFEIYVQKALEDKAQDKVALYLAWARRISAEDKSGAGDKSLPVRQKHLRKIMEAMDIDSTRAEVWSELADYYWLVGDFKTAHLYDGKALSIDPMNPRALSMAAQYYAFIEGDYEEGVKYLDLLLTTGKSKDRGYYLKGILYANLEQQDSVMQYIKLMNDASYSPDREADIWASYYGKVGNKELLIKYAQRGIDYGLPLWNYIEEPPYSNFLHDADFIAFLQQNNIKIPEIAVGK